ncbi:hypothetical protein [Novosphingobium sp.]|uniref:hypothetical protein n=1 Tax=Novosphingobium sp. TaxID=1874826 RepID=UPI002633AB56|nr:hypothetical protein [Novosphingobium sp.]
MKRNGTGHWSAHPSLSSLRLPRHACWAFGGNQTRKSADIYKKAVLGWSISGDGYLHPWTVDGVDDGRNDLPAILQPDGQVEESIDRRYENVTQWYEGAKGKALEVGFNNYR